MTGVELSSIISISPVSAQRRSPPVRATAAAGMLSLAVALGVGRFAFTPLFPFMVRDGLLSSDAGALLAASNYLGYLVGATLAARMRLDATRLLRLSLIGIVIVTAAISWTTSVPVWVLLRFVAGALSAFSLVATTAWTLAWLASVDRSRMAGGVFAGVGAGIAGVGMFCRLAARPAVPAGRLWIELAALAGGATIFPLHRSRIGFPACGSGQKPSIRLAEQASRSRTGGLIICYGVFGFGYILPATYLPVLARQMVDDPKVFGWAWPVFGIAAALSTVIASWLSQRASCVQVWSASSVLMAVGVLLPGVWLSLGSIAIAALLVGGTFMVITMVGMQEAQAHAEKDAAVMLAQMTAAFAFGQLAGPVVSAVLGQIISDASVALRYAMQLAAAGMMISAIYLWYEDRQVGPIHVPTEKRMLEGISQDQLGESSVRIHGKR